MHTSPLSSCPYMFYSCTLTYFVMLLFFPSYTLLLRLCIIQFFLISFLYSLRIPLPPPFHPTCLSASPLFVFLSSFLLPSSSLTLSLLPVSLSQLSLSLLSYLPFSPYLSHVFLSPFIRNFLPLFFFPSPRISLPLRLSILPVYLYLFLSPFSYLSHIFLLPFLP